MHLEIITPLKKGAAIRRGLYIESILTNLVYLNKAA